MIVRTFKPQFAPLVASGVKCQTIRPKPKRKQDMPRVGQEISLRTWTGRPYFSKQRLLRESVVTQVASVRVTRRRIYVNSKPVHDIEIFSQLDGFASHNALVLWFQLIHGLPFKGILIKWRCLEGKHDWNEQTLVEPRFQVAYGSVRTCRLCGGRQMADFTAGRIGGPWKWI